MITYLHHSTHRWHVEQHTREKRERMKDGDSVPFATSPAGASAKLAISTLSCFFLCGFSFRGRRLAWRRLSLAFSLDFSFFFGPEISKRTPQNTNAQFGTTTTTREIHTFFIHVRARVVFEDFRRARARGQTHTLTGR